MRRCPHEYSGNVHGMFVDGVVTKIKGFTLVLTFLKKKTESTSDPLSRTSAVICR